MATTWSPGRFVWRELMTDDPSAASAFYSALFGWEFLPFKMDDGSDYAMIRLGDKSVGGMVDLSMLPQGASGQWMSYLSVEDVEATTDRVSELGGAVVVPPQTIPGVGRFAMVEDPAGGRFSLFKSNTGDGDGEGAAQPAPNSIAWEQLYAAQPAAAIQFYAALIGWRVGDSPGESGHATAFTGDTPQASCVERATGQTRDAWWVHVTVSDIADTWRRALELGARPTVAPTKVAGLGDYAVLTDPTGVQFGLFESCSA